KSRSKLAKGRQRMTKTKQVTVNDLRQRLQEHLIQLGRVLGLLLGLMLATAARADTMDITSIGQGTYHAYACTFDGCQALFPLPDPPLPPLRYHPDYPPGTLAGQ